MKSMKIKHDKKLHILHLKILFIKFSSLGVHPNVNSCFFNRKFYCHTKLKEKEDSFQFVTLITHKQLFFFFSIQHISESHARH